MSLNQCTVPALDVSRSVAFYRALYFEGEEIVIQELPALSLRFENSGGTHDATICESASAGCHETVTDRGVVQ